MKHYSKIHGEKAIISYEKCQKSTCLNGLKVVPPTAWPHTRIL